MGEITVKFTLTRDNYKSIIEMAGHGIGYWASEMVSTKKGCHFTEDETGEKFFVKLRTLEKAALELFSTAPLNDYYTSAITRLVARGDASDVGSDIADAIVQQACFGEVKYG